MAKRKGERPTQTKGGFVRVVGYLSEGDYDRFIEHCEAEQIPQPVIIRLAIRDYLRRGGVEVD